VSTLIQIIGWLILSAGLFVLAPWLGVTVLGIGVVVSGVVLELNKKGSPDGTG
jgi:CHASE2 domain-containing sensor protein